MIKIKMTQLEPGETMTLAQEIDADIVLSPHGEVVKDRTGVMLRVQSSTTQNQRAAFVQKAAIHLLAGMMANPVLEEDAGTERGSFMSYGTPEYGAMRAVSMAEALWNELAEDEQQ